MRTSIRFAILLGLACGVTGCGGGGGGGPAPGKRGQVVIRTVFAGLPSGPGSEEGVSGQFHFFKAGHWTPVYVEIEGKGQLEPGTELVVESADGDDVLSNSIMPLPGVEFTPDTPAYTFVAYTKPGKHHGTIVVKLRSRGQLLCEPYDVSPSGGLMASQYLYLTIGAKLPGVKLPANTNDNRLCEMAAVDRIDRLPTVWYGYNAVDLAIFCTGNRDFTERFLSDSARRDALAEWVRRGGKLAVCVGQNQDLVAASKELEPLWPVIFAGPQKSKAAALFWPGEPSNPDGGLRAIGGELLLTRFDMRPDRKARSVIPGHANNRPDPTHPLVAQGSYGLGRVTAIALDLDQPPFTGWSRQGAFWERLLREAGPFVANAPADKGMPFAAASRNDDSLLSNLEQGLEHFDGIPVISFGWVALFILIYILIVGPLDYLFLKKVVKRLELTWVTFPAVVLIVSVAAYFTAYALKGEDQRVNKLDFIDFDLRSRTVQATTWFSIFSPRVQNYTIGIEPNSDWGAKTESSSPPTVSWHGQPRDSDRGNLFRRSYEYEPRATGLRRVPIPVWASKVFTGCWEGRFDPSRAPMKSQLRRSANNPESLGGSVVSQLPVPLDEVFLVDRTHVYRLDRLNPGERKPLTTLTRQGLDEWLRGMAPPVAANNPWDDPRWNQYNSRQVGNTEPSRAHMRSLMLHESMEKATNRNTVRNGAMREFDQSWRLRFGTGDEVMLIGKLETKTGPAQSVASEPGSISRLWIGALPDPQSGATRPSLSGTMRQETYVRLILPVEIAD